MSFVGPRSERSYFVSEFASHIPRHMARHRVPAGLTGWAQVHGLRGDTSIEERARFDNYYIENWSLWLDMKTVLRTVGRCCDVQAAERDGLRLSVVVPVRDELVRLPEVLAGIERQSLAPHEVVVADGRSVDGSRGWLDRAAAERPWLRVVDNPERVVPTGLNHALQAATGDLVARMDAHVHYDPDYLRTLVDLLVAHPEVTGAGGAMETAGKGVWGRAIAASLRRRVGLGGARHRVAGKGGPIEHVFTGCYRRRSRVEVGGYDERLEADEDFELDTRLREHGGTVWLHPEARSIWYVRESLPALAVQMWRYGYYKAHTLRLHPRSLKPRQFAPPGLVAGLVGLLVLRPRAGARACSAYLAAAALAGAQAAHTDGASAWRGALVPAVVHLSWGSGLLGGLWTTRGARHPGRR